MTVARTSMGVVMRSLQSGAKVRRVSLQIVVILADGNIREMTDSGFHREDIGSEARLPVAGDSPAFRTFRRPRCHVASADGPGVRDHCARVGVLRPAQRRLRRLPTTAARSETMHARSSRTESDHECCRRRGADRQRVAWPMRSRARRSERQASRLRSTARRRQGRAMCCAGLKVRTRPRRPSLPPSHQPRAALLLRTGRDSAGRKGLRGMP